MIPFFFSYIVYNFYHNTFGNITADTCTTNENFSVPRPLKDNCELLSIRHLNLPTPDPDLPTQDYFALSICRVGSRYHDTLIQLTILIMIYIVAHIHKWPREVNSLRFGPFTFKV